MSALKIDRPIFLVGMPRSGTTVMYHALSMHHKTAWFSNYCEKLPGSALALATPVVYSLPLLGRINVGEKPQHQKVSRVNKYLPKPTEAYANWERWCGTQIATNYLLGVNATEREIESARRGVHKATRLQCKKRFVTKFTGPLRIGYLSSIFPDAIFVHLLRDPRAVVHSLLNVSFWKDGGGLERPWWAGGLDETWQDRWDEHGRSPASLAAMQWQRVVESGLQECSTLPSSRLATLRYEEFVQDPPGSLERLIEACDLGPSARAMRYVSDETRYSNMNQRHIDALDPEDRASIESITRDAAASVGYEF